MEHSLLIVSSVNKLETSDHNEPNAFKSTNVFDQMLISQHKDASNAAKT